ncbi:condensation domain-containing protein [Streptomyces sp. NBC_00536]|uniref:condensation domain-containing protein n=1 Tax=Streptomyces sp. NBC_00536 TaxID=2975769 RepID=UPI002E819B0E|nr:condensation domain-containing protein [Streptomyces sp. NBC_00536]WUC83274.1 condensation domain-containing protein [Streptomyces sp. NBC_00536]
MAEESAARPGRCSVTQEHRLLFNRRMNDGRTQPVCAAYVIEGGVEVARLRAALETLARRHDALRMYFPVCDDPVAMAVRPEGEASWPVEEVSLLDVADEKERDSRAQALLEAHCDRPFDLASGPLVAALLVQVSARRHILALTLEHLVCDGISQSLLFEELSGLMAEEGPLVPAERGSSAASYAEYGERQRQALGPDSQSVRFWDEQFHRNGVYPPTLRPSGRLAPAPLATGPSAHVEVELPGEFTARLKEITAATRTTPFMVYLSLLAFGLRDGLLDDRLGVVFMESGRRGRDARRLIGNLAFELCAWTPLDPEDGIRDVLARVRDSVATSVAHAMPLWWATRRYSSREGARETFDPSRLDERFATPWMYFSVSDPRANPLRLPGAQVQPYPARVEIPYMRTPLLMATAVAEADSTRLSFDFAEGGYDPSALDAVLAAAARAAAELAVPPAPPSSPPPSTASSPSDR